MPWKLLLIPLIALPVIEIALFVKVGQAIGWLPTILLAIAAGMIGVTVARIAGWATLVRAQEALAQGRFPLDAAFDGLCILAAGLLFLLPGFLTDVIALVLVLPFGRALIKALLGRKVRHGTVVRDGYIIETDYIEVAEPRDDPAIVDRRDP